MLMAILQRSLQNCNLMRNAAAGRKCVDQLQAICSRKIASEQRHLKESSPSSSNSKEDFVSNEPLKFFGSQAAEWRAKDSRSGGSDQMLWYQPYVISGSLAVFLIYFCILREENDIDEKLTGSLFDHVHGLEEIQLTVNYKYNKENGLSTADIERRLTELGIDVKQLDESIGKN